MDALIKMLELLVKDKSLEENEPFMQALRFVGQDFSFFAQRFNGGNCRQYNLVRAGKYIEAVQYACTNWKYIRTTNPYGNGVDWSKVLNDVKWIAYYANFDFDRNTIHITPNAKKGAFVEYGIPVEYEKAPTDIEQ